jgi:hypothetical protein
LARLAVGRRLSAVGWKIASPLIYADKRGLGRRAFLFFLSVAFISVHPR